MTLKKTCQLLLGALATAAMVLTGGATVATADAGPVPPGTYKGVSLQTHTTSRPTDPPTQRPISFTVDSQGRITGLDAEYFWYCEGYFDTENFGDDPPPTPPVARAGESFEALWEGEWTGTYLFDGTINADGTASGRLRMHLGACGQTWLTWTATHQAFQRTAPYTLPGTHTINGREWQTTCEAYSQTERCTTNIWARQAVLENGTYKIKEGWTFNNLTYLPFMLRTAWAGNHWDTTGRGQPLTAAVGAPNATPQPQAAMVVAPTRWPGSSPPLPARVAATPTPRHSSGSSTTS